MGQSQIGQSQIGQGIIGNGIIGNGIQNAPKQDFIGQQSPSKETKGRQSRQIRVDYQEDDEAVDNQLEALFGKDKYAVDVS